MIIPYFKALLIPVIVGIGFVFFMIRTAKYKNQPPPVLANILSIYQVIGIIFLFLMFWHPVFLIYGGLYIFITSGLTKKNQFVGYKLALFTAQAMCLYFIGDLVWYCLKIRIETNDRLVAFSILKAINIPLLVGFIFGMNRPSIKEYLKKPETK